jgi:hypothetical protein
MQTRNIDLENTQDYGFVKPQLKDIPWKYNTFIAYDTLGNFSEKINATYDATNNSLIVKNTKWKDGIWIYDHVYTNTYNSVGSPLSYLSEEWKNNEWKKYLTTYTYDINQKILSYQFELYTDNKWHIQDKNTYTYNIDNTINHITEWGFVNNEWIESVIETFSFDSVGNLKEKLSTLAFHNPGYISRYLNTYDSVGNKLTEQYEDYFNSQWIKWRYLEFSYDVNGNLTSKLREDWFENTCQHWEKNTYSYDSFNNKLADTCNWWFPNGNGSNLITFSYDINNNLITEIYSCWNNNKWNNVIRSTYTYDSLGNSLSGNYEFFENDKWKPSQGFLSIFTKEKFNGGFSSSHRYEIYQTSVPQEFDYINTYPNPSKGIFYIDINEFITNPFNLKIINSLNQIVYQSEVSDNKILINLPNLSPGMYFIHLTINGKAYLKKIIIQKNI